MDNCIFCKIVSHEIPSCRVFEDDTVIVFLDIHPVNPGHVLVIPKKHSESFYELDKETYIHAMEIAHTMANAIMKIVKPVRVGLVIDGWEISHTHIHVIPTNNIGDITSLKKIKGELGAPTAEELAEMAENIKSFL